VVVADADDDADTPGIGSLGFEEVVILWRDIDSQLR
jgi:hypothetical protein